MASSTSRIDARHTTDDVECPGGDVFEEVHRLAAVSTDFQTIHAGLDLFVEDGEAVREHVCVLEGWRDQSTTSFPLGTGAGQETCLQPVVEQRVLNRLVDVFRVRSQKWLNGKSTQMLG